MFHSKLLNYYEHRHGSERVTRLPAKLLRRLPDRRVFFAFTGRNTFIRMSKKERIERGNRSVIFFNNFLRKCWAFIEFKGRAILTACLSLSLPSLFFFQLPFDSIRACLRALLLREIKRAVFVLPKNRVDKFRRLVPARRRYSLRRRAGFRLQIYRSVSSVLLPRMSHILGYFFQRPVSAGPL